MKHSTGRTLPQWMWWNIQLTQNFNAMVGWHDRIAGYRGTSRPLTSWWMLLPIETTWMPLNTGFKWPWPKVYSLIARCWLSPMLLNPQATLFLASPHRSITFHLRSGNFTHGKWATCRWFSHIFPFIHELTWNNYPIWEFLMNSVIFRPIRWF